MNSQVRLVAYNLRQGGTRDAAVWERVLPLLAPDLLFVQGPARSQPVLARGAAGRAPESWLWAAVPGGRQRWGSGLWVREGRF